MIPKIDARPMFRPEFHDITQAQRASFLDQRRQEISALPAVTILDSDLTGLRNSIDRAVISHEGASRRFRESLRLSAQIKQAISQRVWAQAGNIPGVIVQSEADLRSSIRTNLGTLLNEAHGVIISNNSLPRELQEPYDMTDNSPQEGDQTHRAALELLNTYESLKQHLDTQWSGLGGMKRIFEGEQRPDPLDLIDVNTLLHYLPEESSKQS